MIVSQLSGGLSVRLARSTEGVKQKPTHSQEKIKITCKLLHTATWRCKPLHVMRLTHAQPEAQVTKKSRNLWLRLSSWWCARIKSSQRTRRLPVKMRLAASPVRRATPQLTHSSYALLHYAHLRGRTVKSRTCARMLDICIPFSCERYGITSATN